MQREYAWLVFVLAALLLVACMPALVQTARADDDWEEYWEKARERQEKYRKYREKYWGWGYWRRHHHRHYYYPPPSCYSFRPYPYYSSPYYYPRFYYRSWWGGWGFYPRYYHYHYYWPRGGIYIGGRRFSLYIGF